MNQCKRCGKGKSLDVFFMGIKIDLCADCFGPILFRALDETFMDIIFDEVLMDLIEKKRQRESKEQLPKFDQNCTRFTNRVF